MTVDRTLRALHLSVNALRNPVVRPCGTFILLYRYFVRSILQVRTPLLLPWARSTDKENSDAQDTMLSCFDPCFMFVLYSLCAYIESAKLI